MVGLTEESRDLVLSRHHDALSGFTKTIHRNLNLNTGTASQRVDPIVRTPVESGNVQGIAGHT